MGKGSKPTIGFWYHLAYHHGLTVGPIDAFLEFRGGDKTAWRGELTSSGTIHVNAPMLWGGEKDQGGIVGDLDVMFGEPTQAPNPYLVQTFGPQTAAWRGFSTVAFKGGRYGAMNPYPKPPSYKVRQILQGWDAPGCWYPEKAVISLTFASSGKRDWRYLVTSNADATDYSSPSLDDNSWAVGAAPFGDRPWDPPQWSFRPADYGFSNAPVTTVSAGQRVWVRTSFALSVVPATVTFEAFVDNACVFYVNGTQAASVDSGSGGAFYHSISVDRTLFRTGVNQIAARFTDTGAASDPTNYVYFDLRLSSDSGLRAINPAHVLYYSRTNNDMGRESRASINDASLRAAADKLYAESFGICPDWDPANESVEDFEKRICKLIGGSFTRSLEDGQWYLDLARGDYVLADLPILTDDDILDFKEQPAILDNAVNSVSVRYFDPERKETIVTAPTRALGLVATFGTIHQTTDYRAIPTAELASRIAQRDVMASATPKRVFDLATMRKTYAWRPNQYFRLQAPKRGIADMVCLVGDKQSGTLKSGAIRMKAVQDIYSLPSTGYVQLEPGVDTRPPQTPTPITAQRALEVPYVEVAAMLTRADLAALPAEVGYTMAVAANPGGDLDYSMLVADASGVYADAGRGEWCATATVVEAAGYLDTDFTLAACAGLDAVIVGMGALWGDEIVSVDAIDVGAGTITLGRGCADTVPQPHAAGERLWIYPTGFAYSPTEFTDGETVDVKLLTNTGSQQQDPAAVTALPITFDQRQARPYPPGGLTISGVAYPASVLGPDIEIAFVPRDRVLQADQLVDTTASGVGPEAGTTYTLRGYLGGMLVHTEAAATASPFTWTPGASGAARVEVSAVRDGLQSWQPLAADFTFSNGGTLTITGTFPSATVGTAYDEFVTISGGETPYTLTGGTGVASGSLPAGLSLSIENTDELHLSGTPTTAETAGFTDSVDSTDGQTATSVQSVVVSPAASSYLDDLAVQPLAVLSLRKLISTATKSIRVRRSSDDAEQDIGFSGDTLDTASLAAFVGANSAYIAKIYDQNGAFDAVQATASKQPRIVNAGTYDGEIVFNGTSNYLSVASLTMGTPYISLFSKIKYPTWGAYKIQFELSSDGVATSGGFAWYVNNVGTQYIIGAGTGRSNIAAVFPDSAAHQLTAYADRTLPSPAVQTYLRIDGSEVTTSPGNTSTLTGNFSTYPLYIGARAGASLYCNFRLESVAIYTANTSSIMSGIESIVA